MELKEQKQNLVTVESGVDSCPINANICNLVYPVGSVYISVTDINPTNLFGGTWEQLKDKFLLGAGDSYANGSTGGEATHLLTKDEMPTHSHTCGDGKPMAAMIWKWESGYDKVTFNNENGYGVTHLDRAGGSQPHNNMPPYITVKMWKRTA